MLGAELLQLGLPRENSDGISRPFRIHRERLRVQARADSLHAPRLVSLDWRLDCMLVSSRFGALRQPAAGSGLEAEAAGELVLHLRLGLSHASPPQSSAAEFAQLRSLPFAREFEVASLSQARVAALVDELHVARGVLRSLAQTNA